MANTKKRAVLKTVRDAYSRIATSEPGGCGTSEPLSDPNLGSGCCSVTPTASQRLGYGAEELQTLPAGADMGLGCGNPALLAGLQSGETVLDLGSGAGIDCFLAAQKVGPSGRVLGVDMTPEMVHRARANVSKARATNVEFRLGEIEHLPIADASVDVILSNCVINLSPDKPQVFLEAFRVLKPGGRLHISDVVAVRPMPATLRDDPQLLCGCVSGAATVSEIHHWMVAAGFKDINVTINENAREFIADWAPGRGVEDYVASATIGGLKK